MKKFIKEFKEFISRGNVLDMAIGVIVATAFGKITTSLVNDVFMPFIGWVFGGTDAIESLNLTVSEAVIENGEVVTPATVIGFGTFLSTVIDFIIVAFIVFCIVKAFNSMKKKMEKPVEAPKEEPKEPEIPADVALLTEIRDLLKKEEK